MADCQPGQAQIVLGPILPLAGELGRRIASAESSDFFGNGQIRFMGTPEVGADAVVQFACRQQPVWLDHVALAVHPVRLDVVKPGGLGQQITRNQVDALASAFDLLGMGTDPGADFLADVPAGVVPDQEQGAFAFLG